MFFVQAFSGPFLLLLPVPLSQIPFRTSTSTSFTPSTQFLRAVPLLHFRVDSLSLHRSLFPADSEVTVIILQTPHLLVECYPCGLSKALQRTVLGVAAPLAVPEVLYL